MKRVARSVRSVRMARMTDMPSAARGDTVYGPDRR